MYKEEEVPSIKKELARAPTVRIVEDLDCFVPRRVVRINYSGPNIRKIVREAVGILQKNMRIGGTHVYQKDYYIDTTDPNKIGFHIFWRLDKVFDGRTRMWCELKLKQGLLRPDGSGSVIIGIFPKLMTSWDKNSLLKRNPIYDLLIKMYKYVYYDEERRKYLDWCRSLAEKTIKDIKDMIKLMETSAYA